MFPPERSSQPIKKICLGVLALALLFTNAGCLNQTRPAANAESVPSKPKTGPAPSNRSPIQNPGKLIHVIVALCDNKSQGIVPVPARIGNGDDLANNLYWGAAYGVKSFFQKSNDWKLILDRQNPQPSILERVVFKHANKDAYLVADAYRGSQIRESTVDFLQFAAGGRSAAVDLELNSRRLTLSAGA